MFRQYHALKKNHANAILLFRMGDFYEMFFEDAQNASRLLDLTLTARGKGTDRVVPMCGFPHHQLENYTARLVRARQRVAICDQVEDPRKAKGLVRREVVRMVTPGTVTDPAQLEAKQNVWLGGLAATDGRLGAAFLDVSTGEFEAWESTAQNAESWDALADRLGSFAPREIVHPEGFAWSEDFRRQQTRDAVLSVTDPYTFCEPAAPRALLEHLGAATLDGFGFRDRPAAVAAAGGLLLYLKETQRTGLEHIDGLHLHEPSEYLLLDPSTRRNLELDRSLRDGGSRGSLFEAVDATVTAGGGRMLRGWLIAPLLDPEQIARRQDAIEELVERAALRRQTREALRGVNDIERLLARVVSRTATPRDLIGLATSLQRLPSLIEGLADLSAPLSRQLLDGLDPCADVAAELVRALVDEPPATLREGGVIRNGFSSELDDLRSVQLDGKAYIASLEATEAKTTGIASLKVRYNKVFGYFIEVSKPNLHRVPDHYQRKQTIATGERFITPELKEFEHKVLHAQERIESLELELFHGVRESVAAQAQRLKVVARVTAVLDVLSALAETAVVHKYSRPVVNDGCVLSIQGGRHVVVEQSLADRRFVPNDTLLESGGRAIAVLTGPNMGGKSTYLRQVALTVLMAQSGAFVPAEAAEIGIVDRIFCRVGASDSLAEGQSTFMVEMTETANILHHATSRSLALLDEIGRGTATFDGLSLAWAIVEHLDARKGGAPRTLFATHYHELTELAVELDGVLNLRMAVREHGDGVVFLHRVEAGAADRSYGIHVARLAGIPRPVVARATEILANLERDEYGRDGLPRRAHRRGDPARQRRQPSLFGLFGTADNDDGQATERVAAQVLNELRQQETDRLTPLDALNLVSNWLRRLRDE